MLVSQQAGAGPTMEKVLPDYGKTMSAHADVASKYPVMTIVKAACTPDFSTPKPPRDQGREAVGAEIPCSTLFNHSVFHMEQRREDCDLCTLHL